MRKWKFIIIDTVVGAAYGTDEETVAKKAAGDDYGYYVIEITDDSTAWLLFSGEKKELQEFNEADLG